MSEGAYSAPGRILTGAETGVRRGIDWSASDLPQGCESQFGYLLAVSFGASH